MYYSNMDQYQPYNLDDYSYPTQEENYVYVTPVERQLGSMYPQMPQSGQSGMQPSFGSGSMFPQMPPLGQPGTQPPFGSGSMFPQMPPLGPGVEPPFGPTGQGPTSGPPTAPPPSFVPMQQAQPFAVDPGSIRRCLFRYTYIWLGGFQQFWFYPIFVGRTSVSGWRWTGFRWVFMGISLRQIQSFTCV